MSEIPNMPPSQLFSAAVMLPVRPSVIRTNDPCVHDNFESLSVAAERSSVGETMTCLLHEVTNTCMHEIARTKQYIQVSKRCREESAGAASKSP
jgi:hypothetical protein